MPHAPRANHRPRAWLAAALLSLVAPRARADGAAEHTGYELEVIEAELARAELRQDPHPKGKRISRIRVAVLEVFDERDPVPDFVNVFHITTRERVIRRELLFREGQPFELALADETARNLKRLRQLSFVLIVPVVDERDPEAVEVLVIAKDVWSLRLNSDFQYSDGELAYLLLNPTEENLFGTHASVGGLFVLRRATYSTGLVLSHARILGTPLAGSLGAHLIWNREHGEIEGTFGGFTFGMPLLSSQQRWAFFSAVAWVDHIQRFYVGAEPELYDADATPADDAIPVVYDHQRYVGAFEVVRSYGRAYKLDLGVGLEADRRYHRAHLPPGVDARAADEFVRELVPVNDTRLGPFVQFVGYENRFLKTIELETLGLQEDYRLGYVALLRLYPASSALGSTRDLLGSLAGLSYTLPLGDGLARAVAVSRVEYAAEDRHDALFAAQARAASPRLGFGRLILDGVLAHRYRNYFNGRYALGGDDRLRGYRAGEVSGPSSLAANAEFRTAGVNILSAECGLAAFYDAGGAAQSLAELRLKQSAGLGVRILFPQANRLVFRTDVAYRLDDDPSSLPIGVFATFGQAFFPPELKAPLVSVDD